MIYATQEEEINSPTDWFDTTLWILLLIVLIDLMGLRLVTHILISVGAPTKTSGRFQKVNCQGRNDNK